MKMPSMQFYPADWRKDPGVQALDFFARGVWFEILCLMHESTERGVLLLNGLPMPEDALARVLGLDNLQVNQILTTLLTYGVASKRQEDGALICRRMVRDEKMCQVRREAGKKGGNPNLVNQKSNQKATTGDKQNPTPSSSSSTSVITTTTSTTGEPQKEDTAKEEEPPTSFKRFRVPDQPSFAPPGVQEVVAYFTEQGCPNPKPEAENFHAKYGAFEWLREDGYYMHNWKSTALAWIDNINKRQQRTGGKPFMSLQAGNRPATKANVSYADLARQQNQIDR